MGTNMKVTELDRYLFGQGTHYEIYMVSQSAMVRSLSNSFVLSLGK